jgi:EamA domain-containing membrane protein RarD
MWAYGNHFQVDLETRSTHLTYDVGVACIFNQESQSSMQDQNKIIANLNYVGVLTLLEILPFATSHYAINMQSVVVCNYLDHVCNYKFGIV